MGKIKIHTKFRIKARRKVWEMQAQIGKNIEKE
jgi:hypothetical protein